jgi:hypothetical protein
MQVSPGRGFAAEIPVRQRDARRPAVMAHLPTSLESVPAGSRLTASGSGWRSGLGQRLFWPGRGRLQHGQHGAERERPHRVRRGVDQRRFELLIDIFVDGLARRAAKA